MEAWRALLLTLLAGLFTWLNALKPYEIDDRAYHHYAVEFNQHPASPYGFHYHPQDIPGNDLLVPPVLPYWLALTAANGPESPFIWKCWLFPFALMFALSLHWFFRRFAAGTELPLTVLTLFSPTFLPALNLMLDIPALALGLAAMFCYFRSVEHQDARCGWIWVLSSGILAGLGTQTKYTAFVPLGAICFHSLLYRRRWQGFVVGLIAFAFFVGWEEFVAWRHGESHFLVSVHRRSPRLFSKLNQIAPAIGFIGGLSAGLILLASSALKIGRVWRMTLLAAIPLSFILLAVVPESSAVFSYHPRSGMPLITLKAIIFGIFGVLTCGIVAASIVRLLKESPREEQLTDLFLIAWFLMEIVGAFALSPFQAARRWMGATVVVTILLGRLLVRTSKHNILRRTLPAVIYSIACGTLLYIIDFAEGDAEKRASDWALEYCQQHQAPMIWYVSDGSTYHYYAEAAGIRPWYPTKATPQPGDWVVLALHTDDKWPGMKELQTLPNVELIEEKEFGDRIPLRMQNAYYGGANPFEHHEGWRIQVKIFRWR
jgi:hypothetical protein